MRIAADPAAANGIDLDRGKWSRASTVLLIGWGIAAVLGVCVALAWPAGSMVAAGYSETTDDAWIRLFAVAQAAAFGLFAGALLLVRRHPPSTARVLLLATVIQLVPLAAPLMLSTDAWIYWSMGRIAAVNGGNPYEDAQLAFPADPSLPYTNPGYRDQTTAYGPVFTAGSQVLALMAGEDAVLAAWHYKAVAAALMVLITIMVSRIAPRPAFAAAFVGWNPILALHFAGSGHNDPLMVLLLVAALMLVLRGRAWEAGFTWAVAGFVKWTSFIVLPLQVLEDRAHGRRSLLPGFLIGFVAMAALSTALYGWAWINHVLPMVTNAAEDPSMAFWARIGSRLPSALVLLGPIVLFAIAYLFLLRAAWRGRARRGLAMGLFLLASPYLWTWYVVIPAVLSAIEDDTPALWLAFALCAYGLLYLGDAGSVFRVFLGG